MTRISYIGHSAFELSSGDKSILIDPFVAGNPSASVKADDYSPQAILLTHAHNDHVGDSVEISKRTGCVVISTFELGEYLNRWVQMRSLQTTAEPSRSMAAP